jgi:hypothetical protein
VPAPAPPVRQAHEQAQPNRHAGGHGVVPDTAVDAVAEQSHRRSVAALAFPAAELQVEQDQLAVGQRVHGAANLAVRDAYPLGQLDHRQRRLPPAAGELIEDALLGFPDTATHSLGVPHANTLPAGRTRRNDHVSVGAFIVKEGCARRAARPSGDAPHPWARTVTSATPSVPR